MPINETELIEELEGIDKQDLTTVYNQLTSLIGNLRGASNQDLTTLFDHLDAVEGNLEGLDSRTLTNVFNEIGNQTGNLQGTGTETLTTLLNELGTQEGNLEGVDNQTLTDLFNQLSLLSTGQTNLAGLAHGQTTIATAGTALALNGGTALAIADNFGIRVTALAGNAGNIYVGNSTITSGNGYELAPKAGVVLYITDVSTVYVNGPNAGDGVSWIVES